ncbi:MAG: FliH/SctL family protein [Armatimonadota bacterium]|nr:FliH/SctL family protein [Armatimonadota bacterium]
MTAAREPDAPRWRWPQLDDAPALDRQFTPVAPDDSLQGDASGAPARDDSPLDGAQQPPGDGRQEAERLVEQAQREAADIRRQAREEAIREARGRLAEALRATVGEQVKAFEEAREALLAQMRAAAATQADDLEREVAGLVAQMAAKIVRRTVEEDETVVLDVVRDTIAEAAGAARLTIHVTPAQEPLVREAQAELLSAAEGAQELHIVADDAVGAGGCIVETGRGRFDARVETQLEMLEDELGRVLGGEAAGDCDAVSETS